MIEWAATASGALDLRTHELSRSGYELVATPRYPSSPEFLMGQGPSSGERWCASSSIPVACRTPITGSSECSSGWGSPPDLQGITARAFASVSVESRAREPRTSQTIRLESNNE